METRANISVDLDRFLKNANDLIFIESSIKVLRSACLSPDGQTGVNFCFLTLARALHKHCPQILARMLNEQWQDEQWLARTGSLVNLHLAGVSCQNLLLFIKTAGSSENMTIQKTFAAFNKIHDGGKSKAWLLNKAHGKSSKKIPPGSDFIMFY